MNMDSGCNNRVIDADGLRVEFELVIPSDNSEREAYKQQFYEEYQDTLSEIERLTNNADLLDYALAASSGLLAGFIDVVVVGELGLFKSASDGSKERFENDLGGIHESMNRYIQKYAEERGGKKGDKLKKAITHLENKYPVEQDNIWKGRGISSSDYHHLDDLAHHPTLLGLISAIVVQYLRIAIFASKDGSLHLVFVKPNKDDIIRIIVPIVLAGLIYWLVNMAETKIDEFDEDIPKPVRVIVDNLHKAPVAIEILRTILNWEGHLVSDMGGSKSTAGAGRGIPGVFMSILKEISMLPGIKDSNLSDILGDLYLGTKNSPLTHKLDLRTELTVLKEQALPVIINEVIVRSFYFVRRLITESKDKEMKDINWLNVIPLYNRTIVRMITISTATMEMIDIGDAAIRAAIKSHGDIGVFVEQFLLRINYVGIGRFVLACSTDVAMGIRKNRLELAIASADVAIAADETAKTFREIERTRLTTDKKIDTLESQTKELTDLKF